jgi:predicted permease
MLFDLREAFRSVVRHAKLSALACAILALGIGATTLAFGTNAVAFINTWIEHPERLGWIFSVDTRHANDRAGVSLPDFLDIRDRSHAFASLGARTGGTVTLTGRGQATRLGAWLVTANLLDIWGLPVAQGRRFRDGEDLPKRPKVVVISNRLWQTALGADPAVIGSTITLDGVARTIVGVFDPRLDSVFQSADVWVPFDLVAARKGPRELRSLTVVGILKPGITVAQAHDEVHNIALQLAGEHPDTNHGWDARAVDTHTGRTGPQTYYNLALESIAAGLVLLNGCVNVALLLMSQGIARQKEFGIRLAVGATWLRIVRQQVLEGLLIAVPALLIGFGLTVVGVDMLRMSADPYYKRVLIDRQMLGFAACVSLLTPFVFGIVPTIQLLRGRIPLTTGGLTESQSGQKGHRIQRTLATTQLGAALIVLIVSTIILRSLVAAVRIDVGFDTTPVTTVSLALPAWKYPGRETLSTRFDAFVDHVSRLPGVSAAAASSVNPALTGGTSVAARLDSEPLNTDDQESAQLAVATPRLFETIGLEILSGRDFTPHDTADTPLVAIVSRQFARRYGNNPENLVGRRLSIRGETRLREIVGIAGNIRNLTGADVPPFVYVPHTQEPQRNMFLVARVPEGYSLEPIRRALAEVDADVAPYQLRTFKEWIWVRQSGDFAMFGEFGVLATVSALLAAMGLYGVFSCFVGHRRRDFAVRLALGASPRDIARMILVDGFMTVVPGVLVGAAGGALLSRFAIGVVYGITADPYDPVVYVGSVLLLVLSAAAALIGPALRARSVQIVEVLRTS